jgi:starch synthase
MPKVLMVASEAAPFAKTGGLADVIESLPAALHALGHRVATLLPLYREVTLEDARLVYQGLTIWLGATSYETSVYQSGEEILHYFLDCPELYDRDGIYGTSAGDYPDNHIRFAVLARAALEVTRRIFRPEVIHCHDWETGLVSAYLAAAFAGDPTFLGIKTLLTIHNLGYQGLFPKEALAEVGLDGSVFHPGGLEFFGRVNFLKAGIVYSDAINTVSKAYAREIQTPEYGFGLDGLLRSRSEDLCGILNGADYTQWNPETDRAIAANYSAKDLSGKQACKRALLREFDFDLAHAATRPVIGIVSRFAGQKGFDLIADIGEALAAEDLWLIVQGSGDARYEKIFLDLAQAYPSKIGVRVAYDEERAHRIEAGSDIFLMPSQYEPCGLNQIYSLRYGTIPVVRATGGLDDTIEENTGFKFQEYTPEALLRAIQAALAEFQHAGNWRARMLHAMSKDFSWDRPAREYTSLYLNLLGR